MSVRRVTTTTGWVHPVPGSPSFKPYRVEPIVPIHDKSDELQEQVVYEHKTYGKRGKLKDACKRPGARLSVVA